jgi:hypothetical protein
MLLLSGKNAPVLLVLFGDIQGRGVDARALATINALAVLCNAAIAAMALLSARGHLVRSGAPSSVGNLVYRGLCIFAAGSQFLQRRAASPSGPAGECGGCVNSRCRHHSVGEQHLPQIHNQGLTNR